MPLWSATTCAPYPDDPDAIRALAIDHLVAPGPVPRADRARSTPSGVRAFVQLGVGSLVGFVDDTLRGADAPRDRGANVGSTRRRLAQLARVARRAVRRRAALDELADAGRAPSRPVAARLARRAPMALALGVPLVTLGGAVPPLAD